MLLKSSVDTTSLEFSLIMKVFNCLHWTITSLKFIVLIEWFTFLNKF